MLQYGSSYYKTYTGRCSYGIRKEPGCREQGSGRKMKKRIILMTAVLFLALGILPADGVFGVTDTPVRTVYLNSGAQRDGTFISVNKPFTAQSGESRELHMTGLKEGNYEKMLDCLEENYTEGSGTAPLMVVDEAFCDAEKWDNTEEGGGYDCYQCWLASVANALWLSGWTGYLDKGSRFYGSEDELFCMFNDYFSDNGGPFDRGVDWFFMGEYFAGGVKTSAFLYEPSAEHGHRRSFVSTMIQTNYKLTQDASYIENLLKEAPSAANSTGKAGSVFGGSVGGMSEDTYLDSAHAVTIAGVITDPAAESVKDRYKAIIIIDSDNNAVPSEEERAEVAAAGADGALARKQELKAERINSYTIYPLRFYTDKNGTDGWIIDGYGSSDEEGNTSAEALIYLNELQLPSESLIDSYTETEGNMDHMNYPDLTLDNLFMTEDEDGFRDPYSYAAQQAIETEFPYGDPIRLNYFVSNRAYADILEYEADKPLTLSWKVTSDESGEVVAEGKHICELPIPATFEGGTETPDLVTVNEKDGSIESWGVGDYTLTAELNKDRAVEECYYLNNKIRELHFSVVNTKDMAQKAVEEAEAAATAAQEAVDRFDPDDYDTYEQAQEALTEAQSALIAAQKALIAAQEDLSRAEKRELNDRIKELEDQVSDLEDQLDDASYIDISNYAVTMKTSYTYTGKAIRPAVSVSGLKAGDYDVEYENNVKVGTAKVIITGIGKYEGSIEKTFRITKRTNPLKISKVRTVTLKKKALKKKARTVTRTKAFTLKGAKGKLSYKLISVKKAKFKKYFKVNAANGKITVKKGLKKGTYKVKIRVTASGNSIYKAGTKYVTVKVKVK